LVVLLKPGLSTGLFLSVVFKGGTHLLDRGSQLRKRRIEIDAWHRDRRLRLSHQVRCADAPGDRRYHRPQKED